MGKNAELLLMILVVLLLTLVIPFRGRVECRAENLGKCAEILDEYNLSVDIKIRLDQIIARETGKGNEY